LLHDRSILAESRHSFSLIKVVEEHGARAHMYSFRCELRVT
jgi:hypothetical protein